MVLLAVLWPIFLLDVQDKQTMLMVAASAAMDKIFFINIILDWFVIVYRCKAIAAAQGYMPKCCKRPTGCAKNYKCCDFE